MTETSVDDSFNIRIEKHDNFHRLFIWTGPQNDNAHHIGDFPTYDALLKDLLDHWIDDDPIGVN